MMDKKICIFGVGGFGREALCCIIDGLSKSRQNIEDVALFMDDDEKYHGTVIMGVPVISFNEFDVDKHKMFIAVGNPVVRKNIVARFPAETAFATIIHPNAIISKWVNIGEGSIVTAGTILTCNITIGKHAHLNLSTTVGHDCVIGDYFTTAPAANISGDCHFGDAVYFGTSSSVRQGISICDNVTIGMGGIVVKHITEPGVYIGNPVKRLVRK